ncbi:unnamed protein product [Callosobruchus maculatus]|uniref:Uncharacterized protein n=1 Tax=Callosobruchus maculatus TaxID=64391 RepID=A0A653C9C9_CALMS|nr:unnamed protein product [Callosobruchus maculatus]
MFSSTANHLGIYIVITTVSCVFIPTQHSRLRCHLKSEFCDQKLAKTLLSSGSAVQCSMYNELCINTIFVKKKFI